MFRFYLGSIILVSVCMVIAAMTVYALGIFGILAIAASLLMTFLVWLGLELIRY